MISLRKYIKKVAKGNSSRILNKRVFLPVFHENLADCDTAVGEVIMSPIV